MITVFHSTLGEAATGQGAYIHAEAHIQEGLKLAQQDERFWSLLLLLARQGELLLKQRRIDEAEAVFGDLLARTPTKASHHLAQGYYGLALVAAAQGRLAQARQQAEKSLRLYQQMGHYKTRSIQLWLEALPFA